MKSVLRSTYSSMFVVPHNGVRFYFENYKKKRVQSEYKRALIKAR